jgi:HAD superfamily hydrolase (TIGR01509 family)
MNSFKSFIFDLDGTLLDSTHLNRDAFQYAVAPWGAKIGFVEIEKIRHLKADRLFLDYVPGPTENQVALNRLKEFLTEKRKEVLLFPGILELLKKIKEQKRYLGLWTGRDIETAIEMLKEKEIFHLFDRIVGSCLVKQNKPHPDGLLQVVAHSGFSVQQTVMIGDHEHDIRAAKMAGVYAVYARWGEAFEIKFNSHRPDMVVDRPEELWRFLD